VTSSSPIVRIASRGDGVSADGRHAALAAPGDLLREDGSVEPGPHHVSPPCRHFPRCGGCQLQHVDDAAYGDYLRDRIVGALHAQTLDAPDIRAAHISAPRSRRRASLRAERIGKKVILGFNEAKSLRIVNLAQCEIIAQQLFDLIDPLRELLRPMLREKRTASVQMTLADQDVDLLLEKVQVEGLEATQALTEFAQRHGLARLSVDEGYGAEARWEPEAVTITLGGTAVAFPSNAFLQATADGEAGLVAAVRDAVGESRQAADLFAGLGTFALALPNVRYAAEGARDAALALAQAVARSQRRTKVEHRDLFRRPLSFAELGAFDAVILDPPRSGAREQAAELARSSVAKIAYVSCNPATFARDAKMLVDAGYRLQWIQPIGQFRWSTHVELVALLAR
jgi:23S rRNA (uracil1939-C5)-methyltransferase